jgi:DNA-binding transcriptional ArsR family regulator
VDDETVDALRGFFAALSDETRLAIAGLLATREATSQELAASLSLRDADVGKHLKALANAGIITASDTQPRRYALNVDGLRAKRKTLLARDRKPSPADEPGTPEWERKVLGNFFDGERLKEIPANHRQRLVILAWLANRFEPDQRYPEREVNEIIKRHHPDFAALRRALIDYRYMARESGIYWRVTGDG